MPRNLRCHDVAVVTLSHRCERVRALDSGAPKHVHIQAVADQRVACEIGFEAAKGLLIHVKDRNLVPRPR